MVLSNEKMGKYILEIKQAKDEYTFTSKRRLYVALYKHVTILNDINRKPNK